MVGDRGVRTLCQGCLEPWEGKGSNGPGGKVAVLLGAVCPRGWPRGQEV